MKQEKGTLLLTGLDSVEGCRRFDQNQVYGVAILSGVGDLNGKPVREAAKHPLVSGTWKYCIFLS